MVSLIVMVHCSPGFKPPQPYIFFHAPFGIGASICIVREIRCLPYAGFFLHDIICEQPPMIVVVVEIMVIISVLI